MSSSQTPRRQTSIAPWATLNPGPSRDASSEEEDEVDELASFDFTKFQSQKRKITVDKSAPSPVQKKPRLSDPKGSSLRPTAGYTPLATPKHSVNGSAPTPNHRMNISASEQRTNGNLAKPMPPKAGSSKQVNQTTKATPREVIEISDSDDELLPASFKKPQVASKAAPNHPSSLLPLFNSTRDKPAITSTPPTKDKGKEKAVVQGLGPIRDGHVSKMAQRFDQPPSASGSCVKTATPKKQFIIPTVAASKISVDSDSNESIPLPSIRKPRPTIHSPESSDAGSRTMSQTARKTNWTGASLSSTKALTSGSASGSGISIPRYTPPPSDSRLRLHSSASGPGISVPRYTPPSDSRPRLYSSVPRYTPPPSDIRPRLHSSPSDPSKRTPNRVAKKTMNRFNKPLDPLDVIDLTLDDSSDDADDESGKGTAPQIAKLPPLLAQGSPIERKPIKPESKGPKPEVTHANKNVAPSGQPVRGPVPSQALSPSAPAHISKPIPLPGRSAATQPTSPTLGTTKPTLTRPWSYPSNAALQPLSPPVPSTTIVHTTTEPPKSDDEMAVSEDDQAAADEIQDLIDPDSDVEVPGVPPAGPPLSDTDDFQASGTSSPEGLSAVARGKQHVSSGDHSMEEAGADSSPEPKSVSPIPLVHDPAKRTYGGLTAISWKTFQSDASNFDGKVRFVDDIPVHLNDQVNNYPDYLKFNKQMADLLEMVIKTRTLEDEPGAPPIRVINDVDDEPTPPWEFYYTNAMYHTQDVPPPDMNSLVFCDCVGQCNPRSKTCACVQRQKAHFHDNFAYGKDGKLKIGMGGTPSIFECNDRCSCDDECRNRVVQHGRRVAINLKKTPHKGWGIFAGNKKIPKGTFIGIYAGEIIKEDEAEERGFTYDAFGRTYLFDLDFQRDQKSKLTVDAFHVGNFTRFLNHSCDANSRLFPCYINEGNLDKPLLTIFSIKDIEPMEEICFNYRGKYAYDDDPEDNKSENGEDENEEEREAKKVHIKCQCGAKICTGKMWG